MPFYQLRRTRAERSAEGRGVTLSDRFADEARFKIALAMADFMPSRVMRSGGWWQGITYEHVEQEQARLLVRDWGHQPIDLDVRQHTLRGPDGDVIDIIESWFPALVGILVEADRYSSFANVPSAAAVMAECAKPYGTRINEILDDHDIAYQLVGMEMIARPSMAMHATIVEPALLLLSGRPDLADVERAFQNALRELKPGGDPGDAVTDAGTALQEMLAAVGAEGKALGPLIASAKKRGLLGPHDSKLAEGFERVAEWVSAERNMHGDAHHAAGASDADAWLAVRVAGALILRLAIGREP